MKAGTGSDVLEKVNHLFRHEYGKIVSSLVRSFGADNIELAEDVVQDSIAEAIEQWQYKGIPDNPVGWIYVIAKRKAINYHSRTKLHEKYIVEEMSGPATTANWADNLLNEEQIEDDQLRMMFTCCHPVISSDSQVALTLKTLCGFSIPEIARAFLTNEENINKRLVRARQELRENNVEFGVPTGTALEQRLASVLETLYLMFNEGYSATHASEIIRKDLCDEAIRLLRIILSSRFVSDKSMTRALLSLMLLNSARFKARLINHDMLDLEEQDRSLWDSNMIQEGLTLLEEAVAENKVSSYHILATITAHHCVSKTFEETDWTAILELYDNLVVLDKSPAAELGRVVALSKVKGASIALQEIESISQSGRLDDYPPYFTTKAYLFWSSGNTQGATEMLNQVLRLNPSESFKQLVISQLHKYGEKSQKK